MVYTYLALSDDRLLRKTAAIEGFRVIGTIGVLIQATKTALVTPEKSAEPLNELVKEHSFRIGTRVYEAARRALNTFTA